jgi:hypothetical protein
VSKDEMPTAIRLLEIHMIATRLEHEMCKLTSSRDVQNQIRKNLGGSVELVASEVLPDYRLHRTTAFCECPFCGYERKQRRHNLQQRRDQYVGAITAVADLARVKDRDAFVARTASLVSETCSWLSHGKEKKKRLSTRQREQMYAAAKALRQANNAVRALDQYTSIPMIRSHSIPYDILRHWRQILEEVTEGLCAIANISPIIPGEPGMKRKRGKPKGSRTDWRLSSFVEMLAVVTMECGGKLGASNSAIKSYGEMFEALDLLRPHLPEGFLRTNAAQAIVDAVKSAKRYVGKSNIQ